jgi:hypothetical protein
MNRKHIIAGLLTAALAFVPLAAQADPGHEGLELPSLASCAPHP